MSLQAQVSRLQSGVRQSVSQLKFASRARGLHAGYLVKRVISRELKTLASAATWSATQAEQFARFEGNDEMLC